MFVSAPPPLPSIVRGNGLLAQIPSSLWQVEQGPRILRPKLSERVKLAAKGENTNTANRVKHVGQY